MVTTPCGGQRYQNDLEVAHNLEQLRRFHLTPVQGPDGKWIGDGTIFNITVVHIDDFDEVVLP